MIKFGLICPGNYEMGFTRPLKIQRTIIFFIFSFAVKSGPHQCNVCKSTVDSSRAVNTKNLAFLLGLSESDIGSDTRVCNPCFMKAQRKKGNSCCPIPVCTSTKGRMKGRLRHMPSKLKDLPKDARETINNEFRKLLCLANVR